MIHEKINKRAKLALLGNRYMHIPMEKLMKGNVIVLRGFLKDKCEEGIYWQFTKSESGPDRIIFTRTRAAWEESFTWNGNSASLDPHNNPVRNLKFKRARI